MTLPEIRSPIEYPEDFDFFAFVVENEVAVIMPINKQSMPAHRAAWSSDPKVILLTDNQKSVVRNGWTYDNETGLFSESNNE